MKLMKQLLSYLQGKKSTILTVGGLLNITLLAEGIVNENWAYFIGASLVALGGSANFLTKKLNIK